jgi:hypothetical protein
LKLSGRSPVQGVLQAGSKLSSKTLCSILLAGEWREFYTFTSMGRIEFPSTPINEPAKPGASVEEQSKFQQPTLEGIELEQSPEIELGNCIITTAVKYRKLVRGNEWHCTIQAVPDLLHPEQEGMFEAHAFNSYADMAKAARLRPGDRAMMRGTLQQQSIVLENGETKTVNHFFVTAIEVISRSKRTSITAYEKEKTR